MIDFADVGVLHDHAVGGRPALTGVTFTVEEGERREPGGALTTTEREELAALRKETRVLRMERDFLKKAAAFFAKDRTGLIGCRINLKTVLFYLYSKLSIGDEGYRLFL